MAKSKKLRTKAKKRKLMGIRRKGDKFFTCRYCGKKKKTLHSISQHYKDDHPHAIRKKKPREGLTQKQIRESIKHSSPADVKIVDQLVAILAGGSDTRAFIQELLDEALKKRRYRY